MFLSVTGCGGRAAKVVDPGGDAETVASVEITGKDAAANDAGESEFSRAVGRDAALPDVVSDDAYGTTYEIFVYSFADSNGDGIGDLNGIRNNLDYLNDGDPSTREDLGVNALWLTPIFPSPTYHKYDATDYCSVDPDFGTISDLDALLEDCHERGMRLYLDLAFNHTSDRHFWFGEAADTLRALSAESDPGAKLDAEETEAILAKASEDCPYISYYNFSREEQTGYEPLSGTDWYYEARFWSGMPDLNLDNERVRQELSDIMGYWLARGVDGFRLDAVTSYYTNEQERSAEFLAWLTGEADRIMGGLLSTAADQQDKASHVYMVGEAWENQQAYAPLYETGVDSFFDFAFAGQEGLIAQAVRGGKSGARLAEQMAAEEELYSSFDKSFINAPFYTNHDMARSAGYYAKDGENRVKLAMALNLLQTGNAFVYYGEELGMRGSGRDENKRAPFPWGDPTNLCAGPSDMESFDAAPYGSLADQRSDPDSVCSYIREAIHLRARHPIIARGRTAVIPEDSDLGRELAGHPALCAFFRTNGNEAAANGDSQDLLIIVNTGAEPQTIPLKRGADDAPILIDSLTTGEEIVNLSASDQGDILYLPGYAVAILQ